MRRTTRVKRRIDFWTPDRMRSVWLQYAYEIRARAKKAQLRGNNWRGFHVGQSSLCVDWHGVYHVIDSANWKPNEVSRHCAEEEPIAVCIQNGWLLLYMAVAAGEQRDDFTQTWWDATAPCGKSCRPSMHEEIRRPDGVIRPLCRLDLINLETNYIRETDFEEMLTVFGHLPEKGAAGK